MYLEVGKIPVHEGTWASRTYSDKNPLMGVPLAYYCKSTLPFRQVPRDLDQLVAQRGRGQSGVNYTNLDGTPRGTAWASLPILYDNCWDYGAFLLGAGARYDYAFGVSTGSTGAPVPGPDTNGSLGLHARLGFAPTAALKLHVSFARGAYLFDEVQAFLPVNARARDYAQTVVGGSVEWGWRHLTINSEVFHNQFETPVRSGGLGSVAGYFESVYTVSPGWYVAGRFDAMRFASVTTSSGTQTWDENVQRLEGGVGYHASRDLLLKAVGQVYERGNDWQWKGLLPALQMSFRY